MRFLAGACAAAALVACQGAPDAAPSPPPVRPTEVSVSPTVSPSASGTASGTGSDAGAAARVPAAARAHTFAGAQAFAEFYVAQLNEAWTRPDADALSGLAVGSCRTCTAYVEVALDMVRRHERYDRPPVVLKSSAWQPESTRATAVVLVVSEQAPAKVLDGQGRVVRTEKWQPAISQFTLTWHEQGWRVTSLKLVETR